LTSAFAAQLFVLHWLQGRIGEVQQAFRNATEASPNVPVYRSGLALTYNAGMGKVERDAERLLASQV
jgi:cytochrome c-type biogenesis protein CcmH/NrfG